MVEHVLNEPRPALSIPGVAWRHASISLAASAFGFIAGWLYLRRSTQDADPWAMKMALHMAAWHLLLVLTLFPTTLLGGRAGVRTVQGVSFVFFVIHAAIALANTEAASLTGVGMWIALFNALSGVCFLGAVIYGQRALT